MKKSNRYLLLLCLVILTGMFATNVVLSREYQKIDRSDPYKSYVTIPSESYTVLAISGSNGYPIEITHKETNSLKVLRSRVTHFKNTVKNDTLFIEFTGSNIPIAQRFRSHTPPGIIIEKKDITSIINTNTHQRIFGFSNQDLKLSLAENAYTEIHDCNIQTMEIDLQHNSQIRFVQNNVANSLALKMTNTSIARLDAITFSEIKHTLSDSVSFIISKEVFNKILK